MLVVCPLSLKALNAFVEQHHRHHKKVQGHKFSLGVVCDGKLVGACSVGRPVARNCDSNTTLEVTRLVTDGTKNACSILYARSAQIAKLMGYKKIQTYILESERGTSLKASGWSYETTTQGGQWKHTDGKPRRTDQPICKKERWSKLFD
jgi:hypothetical protein